MKTITTPAPVTAGETTVTLADFVRHALLVDQRFNANGAGIRSAAKVDAALEAEPLTLEDADFDRLLEAVENPQPMQGMPPYPLRPARLCAPFLEAIKAAR
jgi:hypothetical protein